MEITVRKDLTRILRWNSKEFFVISVVLWKLIFEDIYIFTTMIYGLVIFSQSAPSPMRLLENDYRIGDVACRKKLSRLKSNFVLPEGPTRYSYLETVAYAFTTVGDL